ncbi:MAG: ferritin family protein [Candidatus Hydrothermales bacterium]
MELKSIDEILKFAISKEEEAYSIYVGLKEKTENKALKKIFEDLAQEELKHKQKLLDFKEGKIILTPKSEKVPDLKISDHLVGGKLEEDMDIQDILIFAMNREKLAFRLYSELAERVESQEAKDLLISLAKEEAKHKLRLETIYDDYFGI